MAAEEVKFTPEPAEEAKSAPKNPAESEIKKTRVVRVDKAFIDCLVEYQPRHPLPPIPDFAGFSPELRDGARARLQRAAADIQKSRDFCADLQEQYRAKGYAEIVEEVVSDDDVAEAYVAKLKARLENNRLRLRARADPEGRAATEDRWRGLPPADGRSDA